MKEYTIVYTNRGKLTSLNAIYASNNWRVRANLKKKHREVFEALIKEANIPHLNKFSLECYYNSRHDPDNIIGMEKFFMDSAKGLIVTDDSKTYYRGCSIFPDESLDMNTIVFKIIDHGDQELKPTIIWK